MAEATVRGYKAGLRMGEASIEMVHLMYQNNTAAHFLRGLNEKIKEEMVRRHLTSAMHSDAQKQCPSCVDADLIDVPTCPKCGYFERR